MYRKRAVRRTLHEQLPLPIHHGQYISSHTGASAGWTPGIRVGILIVPARNAVLSTASIPGGCRSDAEYASSFPACNTVSSVALVAVDQWSDIEHVPTFMLAAMQCHQQHSLLIDTGSSTGNASSHSCMQCSVVSSVGHCRVRVRGQTDHADRACGATMFF